MANLINYIAPEMIILLGDIIYNSNGFILKTIREVAQKHMLNNEGRIVRIEEGSLKEDAALIGAATFVYDDMFNITLEKASLCGWR